MIRLASEYTMLTVEEARPKDGTDEVPDKPDATQRQDAPLSAPSAWAAARLRPRSQPRSPEAAGQRRESPTASEEYLSTLWTSW